MLALAALLGCFFNRLRGGGFILRYNDLVNALAFGAFSGLCLGSLATAAMGALAMALGAGIEWKRYVSALGGWETRPLSQVAPIDWMLRGWKPIMEGGVYRPSWKLTAWGAGGLGLRGMLWGTALTLPAFHAAVAGEHHLAISSLFMEILWAGISMPLAYILAKAATQPMRHRNNPQWRVKMVNWGEMLYGLALWAGWFNWLGM